MDFVEFCLDANSRWHVTVEWVAHLHRAGETSGTNPIPETGYFDMGSSGPDLRLWGPWESQNVKAPISNKKLGCDTSSFLIYNNN
jgi:hypothetical protein